MRKYIIKSNKVHKKALISAIFVVSIIFSFAGANGVGAKESDITANVVIELVNDARKEANVGLLIENPKLKAAAEKKATEMIEFNYFAHISPAGKSPWDWITQEGYDYRFAGENLAIDYTSAEDQQKAWMDSPLHRKNILNPEYKEIGVATVQGSIDGRKTIVTVQEFGTRMVDVLEQSPAVKSISSSRNTVAGISINTVKSPEKIAVAQSSVAESQINQGGIFKNNKLTLAGWSIVFILATLVTAIDIAVLLYRKHNLLTHEIGSK